jgi:hypothetical protein
VAQTSGGGDCQVPCLLADIDKKSSCAVNWCGQTQGVDPGLCGAKDVLGAAASDGDWGWSNELRPPFSFPI